MIITLFLTATTATELLCDTASKPVPWEHLGPAGYDDGEGSMISVASSGAAQAAVHVNGTSWLLATANGGIWKTDDVTASPEPTWKQALDDQFVVFARGARAPGGVASVEKGLGESRRC